MNILQAAIDRRRGAERAIADILTLHYPPNADIQWEVSGVRQRGVVVMNCYGDRIKVRNTRTGRERWIYATNIVC